MFVEGVFYVGKGKNSRTMQHLKDAKACTECTPSKVIMIKSKHTIIMYVCLIRFHPRFVG